MEQSDLIERLVKLETRQKSMTDRLEDVECKVDDIHRLTTSVELIAQRTAASEKKLDAIEQKQDGFGRQLQELREEPGKKMISMKTTILTAVLSNLAVAAVTALIVKLIGQ